MWLLTLYLVRKFKGRTPAPSDHPSRPQSDVIKAEINEKIKETPRDHSEAKAQVSGVGGVSVARHFYISTQALIRDGYRCVVTGVYDAAHTTVLLEPGDRAAYTGLAHILPESTYFDMSPQVKNSEVKMHS